MRQLPTQWAKLAEARGIAGSANALALRAGIATTTLTRLVFGGSTSPETILKVAEVLGVSQEHVRDLAQIPTPLGVWVPPEQANKLGPRARVALSELILAIIESEDETHVPSAKARQKRRIDGAPVAEGVLAVGEHVHGGGEGLVGDPTLGLVAEVGVDEHEPIAEQE